MSPVIGISDLSPEAIRAVESLVDQLRAKKAAVNGPATSICELFGKAPQLRSGEEIARQLADERSSWGRS